MSFNKSTGYDNRLNFIQINSNILEKIDTIFFIISYTPVTLNEGQGHTHWYQNIELSGLHHHTKFERNGYLNVWIQTNVKGFFFLNHTSRVLSLEYWTDEIKWVWSSSHQWVSTVNQTSQQSTKFHPNHLKTLWDDCCNKVGFLALPWPWIKVKAR